MFSYISTVTNLTTFYIWYVACHVTTLFIFISCVRDRCWSFEFVNDGNGWTLNVLHTDVEIMEYKNKNKPFVNRCHLKQAWPKEVGRNFVLG